MTDDDRSSVCELTRCHSGARPADCVAASNSDIMCVNCAVLLCLMEPVWPQTGSVHYKMKRD